MKNFTIEEVKAAYKNGIIQFSTGYDRSPTCVIGDDWFFFAGNEGEDMLWQEYRDAVGIDTMLEEVMQVLNNPIENGLDSDEGAYLHYYIREELERRVN